MKRRIAFDISWRRLAFGAVALAAAVWLWAASP